MLELEFMRLAFAVGAVVGLLAPAVGFFLVERGRQSLVGDGLGHVAFAGVAAGYLLGISPVVTALFRRGRGCAGDRMAPLARRDGRRPGPRARLLHRDRFGIVLVSSAGRLDVGLFQFLFGSILTVTRDDLWVVLALGSASLAAIGVMYRGFVSVVLDEEATRVAGAPVTG